MSKQNQTVETQQKKQNQQKSGPQIAREQTTDQINGKGLLGGMMGEGGDPLIQAQAIHLSDRRFLTAQRQTMAMKIGRVGGNHYLQRVIAQTKLPKQSDLIAKQQTVIQRQDSPSWRGRDTPMNSYNRGGDMQWSGDAEIQGEEYAQEFEQFKEGHGKALGMAVGFILKVSGLNLSTSSEVVEKIRAEAEERITVDIELREAEISHYESEIEFLEEIEEPDEQQSAKLAEYRILLEQREAELEKVEDGQGDVIELTVERATNIVSKIAEYGDTLSTLGGSLVEIIGGVDPAMFENLGKATEVVDKLCKIADAASGFCDMSALNNFKANPNFETAKVWGLAVGKAFDGISGLVPDLPMGWGDVISGTMQMPNAVITQFIGLVEQRYVELDKLLQGSSRLLAGGEYG